MNKSTLKRLLISFCICILLPIAVQAQLTNYYQVIDLGTLGGDYSVATGINNSGQVVGYSITASGQGRSFLWSNGLMQDLGSLNGANNNAFGINNSGQVVGCAISRQDHAFLWSNGLMQDLGTLNGGDSCAFGINNSGQVVGYSTTTSQTHAFLWSNGLMQDLGTLNGGISYAYGVNNSGQVVGYSTTASGQTHAFLWSNGSMQDLGTLNGGDGYCSWALGINNSGQVVGFSITASGQDHAFLWSNGLMQDLGMLNGGDGYAYGINNCGQVVGISKGRAFIWSNSLMQDLNNLIIPNFIIHNSVTLRSAYAINDTGQIVGNGVNPSGQTHAFLLNPLVPGALYACTNSQTNLPTYGTCSLPKPGQDSLVFVTHGWIYSLQKDKYIPEAIQFVDSMSNSIAQYLADNNLTNWQVQGHIWINQATTFNPANALNKAEQLGKKIGESIVSNEYTHVHFIAHSAGAGLIQKATEVIKMTSTKTVTVHCTFLDAFDGLLGEKVYEYGASANWADSYFVSGSIQQELGQTGKLLYNAYNVDVTALDPAANYNMPGFVSTSDNSSPCTTIDRSSHGWPIDFYSNSFSANLQSIPNGSYYNGFGFPLSEEANNWEFTKNHYLPGNGLTYGTVTNLGPNATLCHYIEPPWYYVITDFQKIGLTVQSAAGTVQKSLNSLWLQTSSTLQNLAKNQGLGSLDEVIGSPVWIATVVTDTNALNYVSFDAKFTSDSGANGLLTVYWDTNLVGQIDEAAVLPDFHHYMFSFGNTVPNTSHVLGFHMDPFTQIQSSIILTNIVTGFSGISQPPMLAITTNRINGLSVYQMTGQPGMYTVQASTNLVSTNWDNIAILVNTNSSVSFFDQDSTNYLFRFYRTTAPNGLMQ